MCQSGYLSNIANNLAFHHCCNPNTFTPMAKIITHYVRKTLRFRITKIFTLFKDITSILQIHACKCILNNFTSFPSHETKNYNRRNKNWLVEINDNGHFKFVCKN
jgi:hypothetical protein